MFMVSEAIWAGRQRLEFGKKSVQVEAPFAETRHSSSPMRDCSGDASRFLGPSERDSLLSSVQLAAGRHGRHKCAAVSRALDLNNPHETNN